MPKMLEKAFQYQRLLLGYHGCDRKVADAVLNGGKSLKPSENTYDWLGHGIYFWEHGPMRALEWARLSQHRGRISEPAVVGAVLHLGRCFDLLDRDATQFLSAGYPPFCESMSELGRRIPDNEPASDEDSDRLLRRRDCAVVNWVLELADLDPEQESFDSVRGLFQEDELVYEGSEIRLKSHIQIAIRDPSCILGYFRPT